MFENTLENEARQKALHKFEQAHLRGQINRVHTLAKRNRHTLQDFSAIASCCGPPNQHYAGIKTVPIAKIRGSESRSDDFDRDFYPRHKRIANHWIGVFAAWWEGVALPPVELVQLGDSYYVRDGHHRISVARSLGMSYIDVEVTVLETKACPLNLPVM